MNLLTRAEAYAKGWRSSLTSRGGLDDAERRFLDRYGPGRGDSQWNAWLDGWFDAASGRERGHLLTCTDRENHVACGAGQARRRSSERWRYGRPTVRP